MHAVDGDELRDRRAAGDGADRPKRRRQVDGAQADRGALKPTGGRILFEGEDITGLAALQGGAARVVRTFQLSSEFARLTVLENLLVAAPDQRGRLVPRRDARQAPLEAQPGRGSSSARRALLEEFRMTNDDRRVRRAS